MSINSAEKKTIWTAVLAVLSLVAILGLQDWLYTDFDLHAYMLFHNGIEYITYGIGFSMLLLGSIFFVHTLTAHRLYLAALYLIVGMMEIMHVWTNEGMPRHMPIGDTSVGLVFSELAQAVGAAGLFLIFRTRDRPVSASRRLPVLAASATIGILLILTINTLTLRWGDALMSGESWIAIRTLSVTITFSCLSMALFTILYRNRTERPPALLTIVQALTWQLAAATAIALSQTTTDFYMVVGHLYKLIGYCYLIKGIYLVSVEEPYRRQKLAEERINYLAYHDELTGLSNRRLLSEQMNRELSAARERSSMLAVLLLDVDRFKTINDSLGHRVGDRILNAVTERLLAVVERREHVFRMGGDEFTILLTDLASRAEAEETAARIVQSFSTPIPMEHSEYHITVSVGISFYPEDADNVDDLIKNADIAMYSAKALRNEYRLFTPGMNTKADERLLLENDMRRALEQQQFYLLYQPQMELSTGRTLGAEALIRWRHPQRGELSPIAFIPIAEENGMVLQLGEWVLREACRQNKAWQNQGLPPITVSVNLSMRQFAQADLVSRVQAILEETALSPQYLELEITESMTSDVDHAIVTLTELKKLGVKISIDDFGTGYSSLLYLKKFPIDKLKIDRSFVFELTVGSSDAAIVTTITMMARQLGLRVTAEGVENSAQLQFLQELQCDEAQGYYFAKPLPTEELQRWLELAGVTSA
ncbi:putative bifunctional diguanylate cyclase/phosphodiesterase [Paenibacillus sp. 598K]|uniref:putative bifunctional diguanylate cyclase/phosphodiesterase n=1 Tax=Paenibacillus sp. 598K TaxID=1117987 RepID=UPI001625F5E8|nr:EAL domain-containing protein [Paenibacillus sp. 598K]